MDTRTIAVALAVVILQVKLSTMVSGFTDQPTHCGNLTCFNHATCENNSNSYKCQCRAGFKGKTCNEDRDECLTGNPCYNRGQCHNTIGSWWCECLDGWNGTEHCIENITESRLCMPGWTGEWCETCLDDEIACGYKGSCRLLHNGQYACSCQRGYGRRPPCSDVDECIRNPCKNSGTCINTVGSYICACANGWTGPICVDELDECSSSPCKNQGICTDNQGFYSCNCTEGWGGYNCDTDINECKTSTPCNGTLVCVNTDGGFECLPETDTDAYDGSNIRIIAGAASGVFVAILIAVLVLVYKSKWKRHISSSKVTDINGKQRFKRHRTMA